MLLLCQKIYLIYFLNVELSFYRISEVQFIVTFLHFLHLKNIAISNFEKKNGKSSISS